MALSTKIELRQGQQLVMTPQLQQAIRLLQLSNFELAQYVEAELERNPLLERDDVFDAGTTDAAGDRLSDRNDSEAPHAPLDLSGSTTAANAELDTDFENVFPDSIGGAAYSEVTGLGWSSLRQRSSFVSDDDSNLEDFASGELSLKEHLAQQLPFAVTGAPERIVGQHLIDMIDEAGYLQSDLRQLATKLGAPVAMVERVLATLQSLDPSGVFARSLAECLAIQLREQDRYDAVIARLLDNLHLLGSHNLSALKKAVGVDADELAEMIVEIKRLNPKPGLKYGSVQVQTVVPDILVRPAADGSWIVELNSETLPRVLVNRSYYTKVSGNGCSTKDKSYLVECLQTANWLVKSLDQRARTILRVAEEIVRLQDGFLMHGVQHLRPLNLRTVADAISMHESTVSRVTSNKYVATPRGIFELKYFFTSAIASSGDGEAYSSESVRYRIRQMIDAETADCVLSDDKIVEKLNGDGIEIARRTVAKYREAMRIASSVERRRQKRGAGRRSAIT